jgi:hypothetical protein
MCRSDHTADRLDLKPCTAHRMLAGIAVEIERAALWPVAAVTIALKHR